jgi:hypothetical protein
MSKFYAAFVAELAGGHSGARQGIAVYQNTVKLGELGALQANFPTVRALLGDVSFGELIARYSQAYPPPRVSLLYYGEHMPAFIAAQEALADLPYLSSIAAADLAWIRSHTAADAAAISPSELPALAQSNATITCHPAAMSHYFEDAPVAEIWLRSRAGQSDFSDLVWTGGGLLITRPEQHVQYQACSLAAHQLLCQLSTPQALNTLLESQANAVAAQQLGQALFELVSAHALTARRF